MTEQVEAHVLDDELAPITGLDAMVATITSQAAVLAEQYRPHEISGEDDYKDSKRARAQARKDIAALKSDYSAQMKVIRDAVKDADARIKAAVAPLDAIDAVYKHEIAAYDDAWRAMRVATLEATYADYAPALMPLVPIRRIIERYGSDKGADWLQRSMGIVRAKELLCDAIDRIADGEKLVEASVGQEDLEAAKADYFSCLDANGAISRAEEQARQRERVRQLEAERRERELMQRQAREQAQQQARQAREQAPALDTRSVMSEEQYRQELAQVSSEQPTVRRQILNGLTDRNRYAFELERPIERLVLDLTQQELEVVRTIFRTNDVHGKMRRVG